MNTLFTFCLALFSFNFVIAQVGIGTTSPQANLDITASSSSSPANSDGVLIPRMSQFPSNPGNTRDGLLIYYTGTSSAGKGFYFWNTTSNSWEALSSTDSDWYTSGTTSAPSNISDNIFTLGNVFLSSGNLSINSTENVSNGFSLTKTVSSNTSFTLRNADISTTLSGSTNIDNVRSDIFGSGSGTRKGFVANLGGTGTGTESGFYGFYSNDNATTKYGLHNYFLSFADGIKYGVYNNFFRPQNGLATGIYSQFNAASGTLYGERIRIFNGSGTQYGVDVFMNEGSGNRYGFKTDITGLNGIPYGVYSEVDNTTTGFSGYFIGRMSFGNTTSNRYIFPAADGAANQVLATDGSGQLYFTNMTTLTTEPEILAATKTNMSLDQDLIGSAWTKVAFDMVEFDLTQNFDPNSSACVINDTGIYRIMSSFSTVDSHNTSEIFGIGIFVNGELHRKSLFNHHGHGKMERSIHSLIQLNSDDLVEIRVHHEGEVRLTANPQLSSFEIERIR